MLKKTTVYLSEEDRVLLKKLALSRSMTFSEALRYSIKKTCKPSSKEEKDFWATIEKVWERNKEVDPAEIEFDVNKAISEHGRSRIGEDRAILLAQAFGVKPELILFPNGFEREDLKPRLKKIDAAIKQLGVSA